MRIAITGAGGLLGSALTRELSERGHDVIRLVRRPASRPDERSWDPQGHTIDGPGAGLDDVDAVAVLSGAGIGARLWTSEYRRQILTSRVESVRTIAAALAAAPPWSPTPRTRTRARTRSGPGATGDARPRTLLVPSAVGVYGADRGDEVLTEDSTVGDDFLARVCRLTEAAAQPARVAGVRVVALRTGIVLSSAGGFLATQRPLYLACLGGPISGGRQWLSWVSRRDHVRAMAHLLLDSQVSGPVNVTAPGAVRQGEFALAYGASLHRPARVPLPAGLLTPVLGPDMVAEVLRAGQRVVPDRLLRDGFRFEHPRLEQALRWVAQGETPGE